MSTHPMYIWDNLEVKRVEELEALNAELLEALKALLSYTIACEELLNASPAGQVKAAEVVIAKAGGKI